MNERQDLSSSIVHQTRKIETEEAKMSVIDILLKILRSCLKTYKGFNRRSTVSLLRLQAALVDRIVLFFNHHWRICKSHREVGAFYSASKR